MQILVQLLDSTSLMRGNTISDVVYEQYQLKLGFFITLVLLVLALELSFKLLAGTGATSESSDSGPLRLATGCRVTL